ncbi:MAG: HD domain-containing protein [Agathobacter sp.]|nr:HD domain-containing protein [Agathobacter sp.]
MRIRAVSKLIGGEILAEAIMTREKEILIPKGTELKSEYIPLIQSLEIESLMLEDPYEDYEKPHFIIQENSIKKYTESVRKLMEGHIYHENDKSLKIFEVIANDIVKEINSSTAEAILDMKERSSNLYEHTIMVTLLSVLVGKKLKLDEQRLYNLALGCLLHDIGLRYVTIPYEDRDLTTVEPAEMFEYKKHTILGYSALQDEKWIPQISRKMILSHHENMEGTGFPMKQKYKETECRIIQACDAFDCYISGMECKRMSVQEALDIIIGNAGKKYDKAVVDNLVSTVAKYPVGTTVKTNVEERGVVISQTVDPENPIIMILNTDECSERNLMLEENISILGVV